MTEPYPTVTYSAPGMMHGRPLFAQPQTLPPDCQEMRAAPRYLLTRPVRAIPVEADGSPALETVLDGVAIDISQGGIGLQVTGNRSQIADTMVIGVELENEELAYITANTKYALEIPGGVRFGARFYGADQDLFRPEMLLPRFDSSTYAFNTGLSNEALTKWSLLGVLRPGVVDMADACYRCESLVTYRRGCPVCGSARTSTARLIHHFACAHVDFTNEFEASDCLQCPKCRTKNLIVGTDYEYLDGPFQCLDCCWKGSELENICQCLRCQLRFPSHRVVEKEVIGYHVRRLDPMALIPAS